ncbi:MAG TPA: hypothetical protein PLW66_14010, partial [Saprospiraceae bacterium]|nr:hypothetical protein [Saprospiraceae bacterium]
MPEFWHQQKTKIGAAAAGADIISTNRAGKSLFRKHNATQGKPAPRASSPTGFTCPPNGRIAITYISVSKNDRQERAGAGSQMRHSERLMQKQPAF